MTVTNAERTRLRCRLDLDLLVFDGDRDMRTALLADQELAAVLAEGGPASSVTSARRDLLLSSLRLTEKIAPDFFRALSKAVTRLGIDTPVEAFCVPDPMINAFVLPPEHGRVLLGISSTALEQLDEGELTFVLGHELGHALFDHFVLTPELFEGHEGVAPVQLARLYAWKRYAELSADRVGLVCCEDPETVVRAFFKLTSGLSSQKYLQNAKECALQYAELASEKLESVEADWFSTHPYSPLRVRAVDVFSRSKTFHQLLSKQGGDLDEGALEKEIKDIMRVMDPSFLDDKGDSNQTVREFLALSGMAVAMADGTLADAEAALLETWVGKDGVLPDGRALQDLDQNEFEKRFGELSQKISLQLPPAKRYKIVEDLVAIALSDEELHEHEIAAVADIAMAIGVDPMFVEETLSRMSGPLD
jgi:Zn-dependent protease with chaperone function/uncharacterized tellurite resistance protein B-like protein